MTSLKTALLFTIGISSGLVIGSAVAALIALLDIIPRLTQLTNTKRYMNIYQNTMTLSTTIVSFVYFFGYSFNLNKIFSGIISLIMGCFLGMITSALAEVMNVIPVFVKKLKLKHSLKYIIGALLIGKVSGSLWYWLKYLEN